jgi:hypothetical protein
MKELRDHPILHGYFRSDNISARNQQAWKKDTQAERKGKIRPKTKLRSGLNNSDGHLHVQGP